MCAALYVMRKRCMGIETFGGDSMLRVESTLLSMLELIDIEKTYHYQLVVPRPCWQLERVLGIPSRAFRGAHLPTQKL